MAQAVMIPPPEIAEAYHQQALLTRPEVKRMTQLDQEIANILSRTDIMDHEKMELYGAALQKFRNVRNEVAAGGPFLQPQAPTSSIINQPPEETSPSQENSETDEMENDEMENEKFLLQKLLKMFPPGQKTTKKRSIPSKKVTSKKSRVSSTLENSNSEVREATDKNSESMNETTYETPSAENISQSITASTPVSRRNITPLLDKASPQITHDDFNISTQDVDGRRKTTLLKDLMRIKTLRQDPNSGSYTMNGRSYGRDLWEKTLKLMTSKKVSGPTIPEDMTKLGINIYKFMVDNNLDTTKYTRNLQFFKDLAASQTQRPLRSKKAPDDEPYYGVQWSSWKKHESPTTKKKSSQRKQK